MQELKCPWPWFGGKSSVAGEIWERFGDVPNFIDPFCGSCAVLLGRPQPFVGSETINDLDGLLTNAWRAIRLDPNAVAKVCDAPVVESDLHAKHIYLVERKDALVSRLEGDPDYFDAKMAGYWIHGMACWIGSGFCSGNGPWHVEEVDGVRQLVHLGSAGRGVNRQLVHLGNAGQGVNRQLVHLGDAGQEPEPPASLTLTPQNNGLYAWMQALAERLKRVRVCCGDWTRVCGGRSGNALKHFFVSGNRCAVFLDPPYADTAGRQSDLYRVDCENVAHDVRDWAVSQGHDPRLRICLCGYDGEHEMPDDWEVVEWKTKGGYASVADGETQGKANCRKERLWFSPHCIKPDEERTLFT